MHVRHDIHKAEAEQELTMSDQDSKPDPRPRPKYGELAPEGWKWVPPKDVSRLDTARPLEVAAAPAEASAADRVDDEALLLIQAGGRKPVPYWNRPVTVTLLMVGLLGMLYSVGTLIELPQSIQAYYAMQGLGTYTAPSYVASVTLVGEILQVLIWLASVVVSVRLIRHQRLSFYVPLLAGVLAAIVLVAITLAVLINDPTLMHSYGKL